MTRRSGTYCDDCGAELDVFLSGGEEPDPDPDRPGKYRPSTTAALRCPTAFEAWRADQDAARRAVNEKHHDHLRLVKVPWPPKPVAALETTL